MKKIAFLSAFVILVSLMLTACRKYEDGPGISFHSRKSRLVNHWAMHVAYANNLNVTEDFSTYTINLMDDGSFKSYTTDVLDSVHVQEGLWDFVEDDTQIRLLLTDPIGDPDRYFWTITRLKEKELWVTTTIDSVDYEFRLLPK